MASVEQQNLLIDHLNRLNQWLTGDQQDRHNEMIGIYARVDRLREDLNRLYEGTIIDSLRRGSFDLKCNLSWTSPGGIYPGPRTTDGDPSSWVRATTFRNPRTSHPNASQLSRLPWRFRARFTDNIGHATGSDGHVSSRTGASGCF